MIVDPGFPLLVEEMVFYINLQKGRRGVGICPELEGILPGFVSRKAGVPQVKDKGPPQDGSFEDEIFLFQQLPLAVEEIEGNAEMSVRRAGREKMIRSGVG